MSRHRVTFTGTWWGKITPQNVVCFDNPDGLMTDLQIATELRDGWCTILAQGQVNTFGWRNISVRRIGSDLAPFNLPIVVNGVDGVNNNDTYPTMAIKFRILTATAGRSGRGRIMLPAYRIGLVSQGELNATGITNMSARLNAIKARYITPGGPTALRMGICPKNGAEPDFRFATDLSLALIPGTVRTRTVGVGI